MAKKQPKKDLKSKKPKKKAKAKTLTQELTEKIAQKVKRKADRREKKKEEASKPIKVRPQEIPEDLRVSVNLKQNQYGTGLDFSNFRYRDLQRACIIRGMSPQQMVDGDIIRLQKWLSDNRHIPVNISLLDEFDLWREKLLEQKYGKGEPYVKLGYIGKVDEEGTPVATFVPKPKKPKKHIEKDKELGGLWKGTKKHLTAECKKKGMTLEKTIAAVLKQFPDAKDSSIKIWFKRA